MPQYGVLVCSPAPADHKTFTADYLALLDGYPDKARQLGGKVLGGSYFSAQRGFAFEPSTTATAIVGDTVRGGPLMGSDLVAAAFYVLSAPDLDIAVQIAKLHPATRDGGVEVRMLYTPPAK
jgi:hypothetical protein